MEENKFHGHIARFGLHQRVEHAQGGGLAGAVGTEQAGDLAVVGGEAHVVHRGDRTGLAGEGFVEVAGLDHGNSK